MRLVRDTHYSVYAVVYVRQKYAVRAKFDNFFLRFQKKKKKQKNTKDLNLLTRNNPPRVLFRNYNYVVG